MPPPRDPTTGEIQINDILVGEIQELRKEMRCQRELITQLRIDVKGLTIKSGIWGAAAGMIPMAALAILWLLKSGV